MDEKHITEQWLSQADLLSVSLFIAFILAVLVYFVWSVYDANSARPERSGSPQEENHVAK